MPLRRLNPELDETKVDIIAVSEVGADPIETWRLLNGDDHLIKTIYSGIEAARIFLYEEAHDSRNFGPSEACGNARGRPSVQDFSEDIGVDGTVTDVDASGALESSARSLLDCIVEHRSHYPEPHGIHFAGHGTGGLVIKQALCLALDEQMYNNVLPYCFSIAFFGVPHGGSNILSEPAYTSSVQEVLGLSSPMSAELRKEICPSGSETHILNRMESEFVPCAQRLKKIWTFIECRETALEVQSTDRWGRETVHQVDYPIVDRRSATLGFSIEEVVELDNTHCDLCRDEDQSPGLAKYLETLQSLIKSVDIQRNHDLDLHVRQNLPVEVHLFYRAIDSRGKSAIKVWSGYPTLESLLKDGPSKCLDQRLHNQELSEAGKVKAQALHTSENAQPHRRYSTIRPPLRIPELAGSLPSRISELTGSTPKPSRDHALQTLTASMPESDVLRQWRASHDAQLQVHGEAKGPTITVTGPDGSARRPMRRASSPDTSMPIQDSRMLSTRGPLRQPTRIPSRRLLALEDQDSAVEQHVPFEGFRDKDQEQAEQILGSFQLPAEDRHCFRWIHLPCNNMGWIPDVFKSIAAETAQPDLGTSLLHDELWTLRQNSARHGRPHARYMRSLCKCLLPEAVTSRTHLISNCDTAQCVIFLPYLHWDTFHNMTSRSRIIEQRREQPYSNPVAPELFSGESIEHKIIWQYLEDSANLPINIRRYLDQYGYPSLRNTATRDNDQVLYKRRFRGSTGKNSKGMSNTRNLLKHHAPTAKDNHTKLARLESRNGKRNGKVLMVDQLWCWIVDRNTVITCFPPKEIEKDDGGASRFGDLRNLIYNDVNGDPRFATQCDNCFDFAALATSHAVRAMLEKVTDKDLQVFRIFEEYISILTEEQTTSFKRFSKKYERHGDPSSGSQHDQENLNKADPLNTDTDLTALLELKDIEDELSMINKLFNEQLQTIVEMEEQFKLALPDNQRDSQAIRTLKEVRCQIGEYRDQVKQMLTSCDSAQKAYNHLLSMKETQANLDEARQARRANEVAAETSRAVMIFTVFTIIFLPLSFFAALFGMNAREWSGTPTNLGLHAIVVLMCAISAGVIVIALLLAFNRAVRRTVRIVWPWAWRKIVWMFRESWKRTPSKVTKRLPARIRELGIKRDDLESGRQKAEARPSLESASSWIGRLKSDRLQIMKGNAT